LGTEASTTPLAQTRAKTYDGGKVPHYGEKFNSIKDLMKRFYYRRIDTEAAWTLPIANGQDPIIILEDPATLTIEGNSALSWYGRMWRFNRNGYRYKAKFTAYDNGSKAKIPISRVVVAHIPTDSNAFFGEANFRSVFPSSSYALGSNATPPLATVTGDETLEFEVPYVREENIMLNPCQPDLESNDRLFSHSVVAYAVYLEPTTGEGTLTVRMDRFTALSDESMFGTFAGVPLIYITPYNTVNSQWYITPPPPKTSLRQETPPAVNSVRKVAR